MGLEMVRNLMKVSARICFRSVVRHPFLVGLVLFFIFMYRSFPFLFSLFLYASPVIVSTALLLATLLSFGQPNLPEIDREEPVSTNTTTITTTTTTTHKSLKSTVFLGSDTLVVAKDRSFDDASERYYTKQELKHEHKHEHEHEHEKQEEVVSSSVLNKEASLDVNNSSADEGASITKENFLDRVTKEATIESLSRGFQHKNIGIHYLNEETHSVQQVMNNHYSQIQHTDDDEEDDTELEKDKLPDDSAGSLEKHGGSAWKPVDQGADVDGDSGDDEDDEASDSGSDGAESSSPDASMADIIPLLDELHPLLDEEAPQPAHLSHDGSDAASEHSLESSESSGSEDDVANHEEFEVGEDEEEEEEAHADKEDETKSAITWTEDDQKNLMNLGTSELERNQRLENLIARRRARKNMRMMAEKNLIDLESSDLPFNVAPISTARHNPFDLPYDSNDNIPGSAPSILLPRRNPFDLPYDSSEEKPDLVGDAFQQDFVPFHQPREPFFRRHESFNVGPSIFGAPRQERQEIKLRPYFVPERAAVEGTSYSSFQRQSSEVSESKMSSIPDTDSVGSAGDLEDRKVIEADLLQGEVLITEHASDIVGHESQSSEGEETVGLDQVENKDVKLDRLEVGLRELEDHQEVESSFSESESTATPMELHVNEMHLNIEGTEEKSSSRSSLSSISDVNEMMFTEKRGEGLSSLEQNSSYSHVDPSFSVPDASLTSLLAEEIQHKEPVYDSSPPAIRKNLSSSSFSTDLQGEASQMGLPIVLASKSGSFAEIESEASVQGIEKETAGNEELLVNSLEQDEISDSELGAQSLTEITENRIQESGFLGFVQNSEVDRYTMVHQVVVKEEFIDSSSQTKINEEQYLDASDVEEHLPVENISPVHHRTYSPEAESIELRDKKVSQLMPQFEQGEAHSWNSDVNFHEGIHQMADEKLVSTHHFVSELKNTSDPEKALPSSKRSMDELYSEIPEKQQVEVLEELSTHNMDISEIQATDENAPPNNDSPSTAVPTGTEALPTSTDLNDAVEFGNGDFVHDLIHHNFSLLSTESHADVPNNVEDVDEIKEIDENLLLDLDTVGDFSVKDLSSNLDGMTNHMIADGESFSEGRDLENKSYGAINVSSTIAFETEIKAVAKDQLEEFSYETDTSAVELQHSIDSVNRSVEVDLPKNTESSDTESGVKESTTAAAAMPDLDVKSSLSEDSSLQVSEFDAKEELSPKSSSSSSSSSSSHNTENN